MSSAPPYVVVVGGANTDLKARCTRPAVAATSNPGATTTSAGGVGRNIAENLARLGTETHLLAAIGDDALGADLLSATVDAGVVVDLVHRSTHPTGTYTAVLDDTGELVIAVADMAATAELGPGQVDAAAERIRGAALVVLDGNLRPDTVARAGSLAAEAGVPVVLEPVSVPKAAALVLGLHPIHTITPNADELAALTGLPTGTDAELAAAIRALHARDVDLVWVRRGARGSLLSPGPDAVPRVLGAVATRVVDVTGAGDAMTAAYCHVLAGGGTPLEAAVLGHRAAAATVASEHTVRPDLAEVLARTS